MAEFIETAFLSRKNSDGVQPALGLYSVESVLVLSVMPLCSSASSSPFSINISSFFVFLFFGKGKGLYAQSVHSLNFMLSKHPPFNLPSLCLGYYLQSLSLLFSASFPFSKLPCYLFRLSLQMLTHPSCILLVLSSSIQGTRSQTLLWDGRRPRGLCFGPAFLLRKLCVGDDCPPKGCPLSMGNLGVGTLRAPPSLWGGSAADPCGAWETCRPLSWSQQVR